MAKRSRNKVKGSAPHQRSKTQLLLDQISQRYRHFCGQHDYAQALEQALTAARIAPKLAVVWSDAMVCCVKLRRWQEAVAYGTRSAALDDDRFAAHDGLAEAYGAMGQWQETRKHGLKALRLRDQRFGKAPEPMLAPLVPSAPSGPEDRDRHIIAFSLFGGQVKYCESAILNALEQPAIYPNWRCCFYVDDTVPDFILERLTRANAIVERVPEDIRRRWPGPMWRLLAYDRPGIKRILFRDADSVISLREAHAVQEWLASDALFHHMRDFSTHTELLLAGLWGVVGGALPGGMQEGVERFLMSSASETLHGAHFADQFFLREHVWPHARLSLMQHDSIFGYLDARPFPDGPMPGDWHVGCVESAPTISASTELPNGERVRWTLYRKRAGGEEEVCSYPGVVAGGAVSDNLPRRYTEAIKAGEMLIRIRAL